jgi:hypothetical protein
MYRTMPGDRISYKTARLFIDFFPSRQSGKNIRIGFGFPSASDRGALHPGSGLRQVEAAHESAQSAGFGLL